MNFEKENVLSLWLFLEKPQAIDNAIIRDYLGVGVFDEDMLEVGGSETWDNMSLDEVFTPMSYSESWKKEALQRASEMGVNQCRRAFLILDLAYDTKRVKKSVPVDPLFLGVISFEDED